MGQSFTLGNTVHKLYYATGPCQVNEANGDIICRYCRYLLFWDRFGDIDV